VRAETRHSLKEDRFSKATMNAAETAVHWSVEHKNKVITAAVAVVVVAAVVLGAWYYFEQQDLKASAELSKAVRTLDTQLRPAGMPPQPDFPSFASAKERATEAHKQFQAIVDQYPHTRSGEFARYFAGLTASEMGDMASAERDLKEVASSHHEDIASLAKLTLAAVYRRSNRDKDAIALYNELIAKPTRSVGKGTAQMELASLYSATQPAEAKRIYAQIAKENPNTQLASLASSKMQEIK
jgi:predicted negative regulator of RcsB-dependent stress response